MSAPESSPQEIAIRGSSIELAQLLKFAALVETGGAAKQVIGAGQVSVNGAVELRRSRQLGAGDRVAYAGRVVLVRATPHSAGR